MADFNSMTVLELRKYAREHGVTIGAGKSKADIVALLMDAEGVQSAEPANDSPAEAAPAQEPVKRAGASFMAAWHNPAGRYAAPQRGAGGNRPQRPTFSTGLTEHANKQRMPASPRFGPGALAANENTTEDTYTPAPRTVRSWGPDESEIESPQMGVSATPPVLERTTQQAPDRYPSPVRGDNAPRREDQQDLFTPEELKDGLGIMEMHPDGYAFLRVNGLSPSANDIYIAPAQIKRYQLRPGDLISGKVRPQREGDRFASMMTVQAVNQIPVESLASRPAFDSMTAIYPNRPINLTPSDSRQRNTRILDMVAPIGFGQRALVLCQPDTGKAPFLRDLANTIVANHPNTKVFIVLLDENPEDVTLFRDTAQCPIYATTFDQLPENHLRLSELALERAERLVEEGKDVVLMVDSLTRLAKSYSIAAAQQGKATPGAINPSSLYRARRLFGAARALREGGSLTILGCINVTAPGKQDNSIIEEFREAANCVITLDSTLARAGVRPTISFHQSGTKRFDGFVSDTRKEGLRILRKEFSGLTDAAAIKQLNELANLVPDNDTLFDRLPEWMAMLGGVKETN